MSTAVTLRPTRLVRWVSEQYALPLLVAAVGFTLVFGGIGVVLAMAGTSSTSGWDLATWGGPKYFLLGIGVSLVPVLLPCLVTNGVTRRDVVVATALFIVGVAAVAAAIMTLGYQIEGAVFTARGLEQATVAPHLFSSPSQVGLVFGEFLVVFGAHIACGWLVGAAFYRFGPWGGLAFLPLGLLPALLTDAAMAVGWLGSIFETFDRGALSQPGALAVGAAAVAAAVGAARLLTRDVAIRP